MTKLASISHSYMYVTDSWNLNILHMPENLAMNYNYTSLYSPELIRYTGYSTQEMKSRTDGLVKYGEDEVEKFNDVKLVKDPTTPTLITASQIHVRSYLFTMMKSSNYSLKFLYYFSEEDLKASKTLIEENIKAAQFQITYLALIIIIIICAVVMCISFRYTKV